MALPTTEKDPQHLRAIVDMGSNGIRFSISSLQPPTARIMPTLYQNRAGISLYDAQYNSSGERQPIDEDTIKTVISAFQSFKRTCEDFGVPRENVTVLATEATRTAENSEDFRKQIKDAVGWDVTMLAKEDEGRIGAMGIASSLPSVNGLVMDLGGGSTQLSRLMGGEDGEIHMPESGSISMPYGAAAIMRRLTEADRDGVIPKLKAEVMQAVKDAYRQLNVPEELSAAASAEHGFTLYLSGGGFRGWGYVLMSQHSIQPYPIPTINGFKAARNAFMNTDDVKSSAAAQLQDDDVDIFGVSNRRAGQVPAVAFLITALAEALPEIKQVRFCQGGVREGQLFSSLASDTRKDHPLVVATLPFSTTSSSQILDIMMDASPSPGKQQPQDKYSDIFIKHFITAFVHLMYYYDTHSKDLQTGAALRSTTSGILAGAHGILHEQRALLALLLCARWGGEVAPTDQQFKQSLEQLVGSQFTLWWVNYLGAVSSLIAAIFPAGVCGPYQASRLRLRAEWKHDESEDTPVLVLGLDLGNKLTPDMLKKEIKAIEKVGKKKNWIGGKGGIGYKVQVETQAA